MKAIKFRAFGAPTTIREVATMAASQHLDCPIDELKVRCSTPEPCGYDGQGTPYMWYSDVIAVRRAPKKKRTPISHRILLWIWVKLTQTKDQT